MDVTAYLVYDSDTGDVIHVHLEPAGLGTSREEIIQMANPEGKRRLDLLELPGDRLPTQAVRVEDGELREADTDVATGGGGVAGGFAEPSVQRRYERLRPGNGDPASKQARS